ncbi:MAG: glycine cleavage T protein (aminomethyl transferase), partial [bacterium]|nr:glycine cleavage T protein (aminomethyl transferase) [bacterium]
MIKRIKTPTLRVDTGRRLSFTFGDQPMEGCAGDTVATALLSNNQRILSRSFKYHRPRGLFSLNGESSCSSMEIDKMPNARAELTALAAGMEVKPQNVVGSLNFDFMAVTEWFSKYLKPGFYYKVFHKPSWLWPFFQERIRKAAGVGSLNNDWRPGKYDNLYLNSDVCVVGGGRSGLSAAKTAA